ncbi:hypothetical protein A3L11_07830 [Thermococcus siculi]|uniref:Solute-binding protein family 5 domain-containing protein n=1 Tax=Thermococcus siculi TaxID=72803 RepID=A0A2Z2MLA1_9EURY|nr:ABC transporter substrate-binding protein [Thermococcus siculi]ASJ09142.1 hypothetical protein A3L11_07830 [Thermococcus siculi]
MKRLLLVTTLVLMLLVPSVNAVTEPKVSTIELQGIQNSRDVVKEVAEGRYDIGIISMPMGEYIELGGDVLEKLNLYPRAVSYNELTFNTYHDPDKDAPIVTVGDKVYFNPFAVREVRFALNYLINRSYIAGEIYGGGAAPMFGCIRPSHPADRYFEPVYRALNLTAAGNLSRAMELFNQGMEKAVQQVAVYNHTLEKINGTWYFDGEPVTVKFVIRIEDERHEIGRYIANLIQEHFGFKVEKLEWDRQKAVQVVFATPPSEYEWNVYTGGWGTSGIPSLWVDDYTAWFYSAWYGYLPGKDEPKHRNTLTVGEFLRAVGDGDPDAGLKAINTTFYKKAAQLGGILGWTEEELTKLLVHFSLEADGENYTIGSPEQYWDLQRISMGIGIMEGARIFLVEVREFSPVNRERVSGVKADPNVGLFSRWSLLSAETPDGVLRVGHMVYTCAYFCSPFNPVGGFRGCSPMVPLLWGLLHDEAGYVDSDGLYKPYRCTWEVERGNFTVPVDAVIYNQTQGWIAKNAGRTARVRVRVACDLGQWHDGTRMSIADLKYYVAFLYTWAYKDGSDDPYYEEALSEKAEMLNRILGFEFTDNGYVAYGSFVHPFADDVTARVYVLYPDLPWELYYAMGELVANGTAYGVYRKYSFGETHKKAECLNLLTREHAEDVRKVMAALLEKKTVPEAIAGDVSNPDERYARAIRWIDTFGHAVISNGPFYIEENRPAELFMKLRAFRGESPLPSPSTTTPLQNGSSVSTTEDQNDSRAAGSSLIYIALATLLILVVLLIKRRK